MKVQEPHPLRFVAPLAIGFLPMAAAFFWLHIVDVVHQMAKMPPPTISTEVALLVCACIVLGGAVAAWQFWADFIRGDYYFELMEWRERRHRR